jgi:hypothetical protein
MIVQTIFFIFECYSLEFLFLHNFSKFDYTFSTKNSMELSHAISDSVLALTGFFVFFKYLRPLEMPTTLLWEAFVLSVAVAALFGAIGFAGYLPAKSASMFFQVLAGSAGALALVSVVFMQVMNKKIDPKMAYVIVGLGMILFTFIFSINQQDVLKMVSNIAIPLVFLLGVFAFFKGQTTTGTWAIAAVIALVLATFNQKILANAIIDKTDLYHIFLIMAIFALGKVAEQNPVKG